MPSPQRTSLFSSFHNVFPFLAVLTLCFTATGAWAAAMATADASGGYAGKMLDKIVDIWAPPPALKGDFQVQLKVGVDGKGKVQSCTPVRASGMEALDSSACGAVRQIDNFGKTPHEKPLEVHLSFWTGTPRGKARNQIPDDAESLRLEERARIKAEAAMSDNLAAGAEERARQRAEETAKATGKDMPGIKPTIVAPAHPAAERATSNDRKKPEKTPLAAGRGQDSSPAKVSLGGAKTEKKQGKSTDEETKKGAAEVKAPPLTIAPSPLPVVADTEQKTPLGSGPASTTGSSTPAPVAKQAARPDNADTAFGSETKAQYRYGKKYSKYFSDVVRQLAESIIIPVETPPGTYYPTVRLKVNPQTGVIEDVAFVQKSGDKMLDAFVRKGIRKVGSIPLPPEGLENTLDITLTLVRR
ncbi:MAG: TonB C-terminal domain-containing protein [Desulfovibrio sp.]|uniref:TonB C-terminal domain-containing protein n=1 Tax=Desulfovibrio sp. TaxID=885 RepID=UPI0039E6F31A